MEHKDAFWSACVAIISWTGERSIRRLLRLSPDIGTPDGRRLRRQTKQPVVSNGDRATALCARRHGHAAVVDDVFGGHPAARRVPLGVNGRLRPDGDSGTQRSEDEQEQREHDRAAARNGGWSKMIGHNGSSVWFNNDAPRRRVRVTGAACRRA
jgi:hypothetical protein